MATFSDRLSDPDYKNWLKIGLGLRYLKEGLSDYVEEQARCVHDDILKALPVSPPPTCARCTPRDINLDKKRRLWRVKCPNNVCDSYLTEILKEHVSPSSKAINWTNSDPKDWPTDHWSVAKCFMNPGQTPANKSATDSDCSALMNLMIRCKRFHANIPVTLTGQVREYRNLTMHSSTMSVSSTNLASWLTDMVDMLKKIPDFADKKEVLDAVTCLEQTRDTEIELTAKNEEGILADKVTAIEQRLVDMEQKLQSAIYDTDCVSGGVSDLKANDRQNIEALTTSVESTSKEVLYLTQTCDHLGNDFTQMKDCIKTLSSFVEENKDTQDDLKLKCERLDIHTSQLLTTMEEVQAKLHRIENTLQEIQGDIAEVKARVEAAEAAISELEKGMVSMGHDVQYVDQRLKEIEDVMSSQNRGKGGKAFIGLLEDTGPELANMKKMTQQLLKSKVIGHSVVRTKQIDETISVVQRKGSVVVSGKPGEGKTTTGLYIMSTLTKDTDRCLVMTTASDWKHVDVDKVDSVLIDDIFGMYRADMSRLQDWLTVLDSIQACAVEGRLNLIICTRESVLLECINQVKKYSVFSHKVLLSSDKLDQNEKEEMLRSSLQQNGKVLDEDAIKQYCSGFSCPLGFPYCCYLFSTEETIFAQNGDFFRKPYEVLMQTIKLLDASKLLALLSVFSYGGKLNLSAFEDEVEQKTFTAAIQDLTVKLGIENGNLHQITSGLKTLAGIFVEENESVYEFIHNIIYESVGLVFGKLSQSSVIKTCTLDFLCQCVAVRNRSLSSGTLFVPPGRCYEVLAERMIVEVCDKNNVQKISQHDAFMHQMFVDIFFNVLKAKNMTNDFFKKKSSEGGHIFPEMMKTKSGDIRYMTEKCLQVLECPHSIVWMAEKVLCWKCEQKHHGLENAFINEDPAIPLMLMDSGAVVSLVGLLNCVEVHDETLIRVVVNQLKRTSQWKDAKPYLDEALVISYSRGMISVAEELLKFGSVCTEYCVLSAVSTRDPKVVSHALWILKDSCDTQNQEQLREALKKAYKVGAVDVANEIISAGIDVSRSCLLNAVISQNLEAVKHAIQVLMEKGSWDEEDALVQGAIDIALGLPNKDIPDFLMRSGVQPTSFALFNAILTNQLDAVKLVTNRLKDVNLWGQDYRVLQDALKLTLRNGRIDISDFLLISGADFHREMLVQAVLSEQLEVVKFVLDLFDETEVDTGTEKLFKKCIQLAERNNDSEIVDVLKEFTDGTPDVSDIYSDSDTLLGNESIRQEVSEHRRRMYAEVHAEMGRDRLCGECGGTTITGYIVGGIFAALTCCFWLPCFLCYRAYKKYKMKNRYV